MVLGISLKLILEKGHGLCALYGLKSSGAAFHKHLGKCMHSLGYKPCLVDPDSWLKPVARKESTEYYSYILNYVADIMMIHHDAIPVLEKLINVCC